MIDGTSAWTPPTWDAGLPTEGTCDHVGAKPILNASASASISSPERYACPKCGNWSLHKQRGLTVGRRLV